MDQETVPEATFDLLLIPLQSEVNGGKCTDQLNTHNEINNPAFECHRYCTTAQSFHERKWQKLAVSKQRSPKT